MTRYRAGVIGLGRMGSTFDDEIRWGGLTFLPYCHGPAYYHSPLVDLVAGADLHPDQRSVFGERWGIGEDHMYAGYNEMLAQEDLDIVSVCTTARHRSRIVQEVAKSSVKVIWAEKPMSLSLEEADEMVRACRDEGVRLAVNCARRWHPLFNEAKQMIEAGELGDILQVTGYGKCKLSINGSHLLDIIHYMAGGKVEWLWGEMESDEEAAGDDDLAGNAYLAFDNGVRGYVRSMDCGAADWEIDVVGEKGRIRSMGNGMDWEMVRLVAPDRDGHGARPLSTRAEYPLASEIPIPLPDSDAGRRPEHRRGPGLVHRKRPRPQVRRRGRPGCAGGRHRDAGIAPSRRREGHAAARGPLPADPVQRDSRIRRAPPPSRLEASPPQTPVKGYLASLRLCVYSLISKNGCAIVGDRQHKC